MAEETNIAPVAPEAGRSGRTFDAKDIEEHESIRQKFSTLQQYLIFGCVLLAVSPIIYLLFPTAGAMFAWIFFFYTIPASIVIFLIGIIALTILEKRSITNFSRIFSKTDEFDSEDIKKNRYIATLSYMNILVFIPFFFKKDSEFSQFHAKQGLVILAVSLLSKVLLVIPAIGFFLQLIDIAILIAILIALVRTYFGEAWEIPYVKDIVKKLNI